MTRVSGTQGYGEHAMALAERYEASALPTCTPKWPT